MRCTMRRAIAFAACQSALRPYCRLSKGRSTGRALTSLDPCPVHQIRVVEHSGTVGTTDESVRRRSQKSLRGMNGGCTVRRLEAPAKFRHEVTRTLACLFDGKTANVELLSLRS